MNNFKKDFNKLIEDIDNMIISVYEKYENENGETGYNTSDLQDIIIALIINHSYSSKDSIQELIFDLEKLEEEY